MFNIEKVKDVPLMYKVRMSAVTTPFQQQAESQENKIKVIEISKEIKLSLFTNDIIMYVESLNESTTKLS